MMHDVRVRPWASFVGLFRGVEATTWGGLLLGNVWPAYLFALPLLVRLRPPVLYSLTLFAVR